MTSNTDLLDDAVRLLAQIHQQNVWLTECLESLTRRVAQTRGYYERFQIEDEERNFRMMSQGLNEMRPDMAPRTAFTSVAEAKPVKDTRTRDARTGREGEDVLT